jgi:diguanylate cyclase (GGDEF)-like protein/PAS domain S-box-containing protein
LRPSAGVLNQALVGGALLLGTVSLHGVATWRAVDAALSTRRRTWIALAVALALLALWRVTAVYDYFVVDAAIDVPAELLAGTISLLALVGISGARRQELALRDSEYRFRQVSADSSAELERLARDLIDAEARYSLAAAGAGVGLWDWDLDSGRVNFSPHFAEMLATTQEELGGEAERWIERIHTEDAPAFRARLLDHIGGKTPCFECEYRILLDHVTQRHMRARGVAVRDASGRATRIAGSQIDVTEQRRTEERLTHGALHDGLTGLPNRALLGDRLARCAARAERRRQAFAIVAIDLDRMHVVNESFGHAAGDELLMDVARKLHVSTRPGDTVARVDGDQFVVLLEDLRIPGEAREIAECIQTALAAGTHLRGQDVVVTASIGVATSAQIGGHADELLRAADAAMYRAKGLGGARVELFDEAGPASTSRARLALETELRRAISRCEIEVAYQPIVSLGTGRIGGFEALARWPHPERGSVPPSEFIPVAERAGILPALERYVLANAAATLAAWQRELPLEPPLSVAVNLSPRRFAEEGLVEEIERVMREHGLAPGSLELEITEGTLLDSGPEVLARLEGLRDLGAGLVIDDFGTGYSSFRYLHDLPIDTLKIDQSFVRQLGTDRGEIVSTILALARQLRLDAVAEGVETPEQLARLREFGCNWAQGFFFARALPPQEAFALVQREVEVLDATHMSSRIRVRSRRRSKKTRLA